MNSKDTEKNKVHFSNASNGPEKDDIISLYGTPKEEMLPGVSADGYRAEDEESLSHKGKLYLILKSIFKKHFNKIFTHCIHVHHILCYNMEQVIASTVVTYSNHLLRQHQVK